MNMVGHQAVSQDLDLVGASPFPHQFDVPLVILIAEKRLLSTVSSLSDVMRQTRCDNASQPCHHFTVSCLITPVNN
jgi:hypothetical protein